MQDGGIVTGPELLYYIKGMPTAVLINICISFGLLNRVRYQAVGII